MIMKEIAKNRLIMALLLALAIMVAISIISTDAWITALMLSGTLLCVAFLWIYILEGDRMNESEERFVKWLEDQVL